MKRRYLLFAELSYAFEILRPLQEAAWRRGDEVAWYLNGPDPGQLQPGERLLRTVAEVKAFAPDAVLVPGNEVPPFFPGLKVQVFHGLGIEKKGHFRIRGMFDLFCTFGPLTTAPFERLARQHGWFRVVETGWPKTDPLFGTAHDPAAGSDAHILYAPTFSPSLTSAPFLAPVIADIVARRPWRWTVKFHPKMDPELAAPLRAIRADNYAIAEGEQLLPLLREATVMVTDTSSAAAEFMLLGKPVVAFRNRAPGPHLVNISEPAELEGALAAVLEGRDPSLEGRERYAADMHPYRDGRSSERVLDAVERMLEHPDTDLKRKPWSPLRRFRYWRQLR